MRLVSTLIVGALLIPGLAACSDDKGSGVEVGIGASLAPEDVITSAANVAKGLGQIIALSATASASASVDKDKAVESAKAITPIWLSIEGTVKKNDSSAYLEFEDNFASLENAAEDGNSTRAVVANSRIAVAAKTYLAKYPG